MGIPCSARAPVGERPERAARRRRVSVLAAVLWVVWFVAVSVRQADAADSRRIQAKLDEISQQYSRIESDLARTDQQLAKLETDLSRADRVLGEKSALMRARVGYVWRHASFGSLAEGLLTSEDPEMFIRRLEMIQVVGSRDKEIVDEVRITRARGDDLREQLGKTRKRQSGLAASLKAKQKELEGELRRASAVPARDPVARAAPRITVAGFTLPVLGPRSFADSWGAPRSGGRRHQGNDVMAACGAQAVAVADGVITGLSSHGRGGIMLWLTARGGDVFFYAHLRGYATGVHVGRPVQAGEVIAYVGNTGNASGGPCHIHFEWHPRSGAPADPYRLLRSAM